MTAQLELWGLPGAGKSTIARRLREEGENVPPLRSLRWSLVRHPFVAAATALQLAIFAGGEAPTLFFGRGRSAAALAVRQAATLASERGRPVLFEEGVLHEIWRILYAHPEEVGRRWWRAVARRAGPAVAILHVRPERALRGIVGKPRRGPVNAELSEEPLGGPRWRRAEAAAGAIAAAVGDSALTVAHLDLEGVSIDQACELVRRTLRGT